MMTVVSILLSDIVPLRERGTWQGYINIVYVSIGFYMTNVYIVKQLLTVLLMV